MTASDLRSKFVRTTSYIFLVLLLVDIIAIRHDPSVCGILPQKYNNAFSLLSGTQPVAAITYTGEPCALDVVYLGIGAPVFYLAQQNPVTYAPSFWGMLVGHNGHFFLTNLALNLLWIFVVSTLIGYWITNYKREPKPPNA